MVFAKRPGWGLEILRERNVFYYGLLRKAIFIFLELGIVIFIFSEQQKFLHNQIHKALLLTFWGAFQNFSLSLTSPGLFLKFNHYHDTNNDNMAHLLTYLGPNVLNSYHISQALRSLCQETIASLKFQICFFLTNQFLRVALGTAKLDCSGKEGKPGAKGDSKSAGSSGLTDKITEFRIKAKSWSQSDSAQGEAELESSFQLLSQTGEGPGLCPDQLLHSCGTSGKPTAGDALGENYRQGLPSSFPHCTGGRAHLGL